MRALLIDDEPLARRELRRLLKAFPWVEIVGEAANVGEAEVQAKSKNPELLFLDIQMPGGTGFDLLDRLDRVPQVIFTTAFDQHAVRAFQVNALDYLLKPIELERLGVALARVRTSGSTASGEWVADVPLEQRKEPTPSRARARESGAPPRSTAVLSGQPATDHQPGLRRERRARNRRAFACGVARGAGG